MRARSRIIIVLTLLASAAVSPAWSQTQYALNMQAKARFDTADKRLNAAYKRLIGMGSPEGKVRLRQAQRDWLTFRDSDCDARAGSRGGSFYPASQLDCRAALTSEINCPEGDMGCGGVQTPDD